jgi:hypothetical protein
VLGLPEVVAVGQAGGAALELEAVAFEGDVAGERGEVDQAGRQVRAEGGPCLELALVGVLDVLDDVRGGDERRVGEGVGDDLGAEVEVRVAVADEDGRQPLAGVQDLGDQAVAVGAGESGVDEQRLVCAGDEGGGLVPAADGEVEVEDLEGEGAHGRLLDHMLGASCSPDTTVTDASGISPSGCDVGLTGSKWVSGGEAARRAPRG